MFKLLRYSEMKQARNDLNTAIARVEMLKRQEIIDDICCTSCVQQLDTVLTTLNSQIQQREATLRDQWANEDDEAAWRKNLDQAEQELVDQWDSQYQSQFENIIK